MNMIKFSENYPKLWNQTSCELLAIRFIEPKDFPLHLDLVEYDTKNCKGEYYPIPKGKYLQLFFVGNKGIPFCTIRRYTPIKWSYYSLQVEKPFEIKIEQKEGVKK